MRMAALVCLLMGLSPFICAGEECSDFTGTWDVFAIIDPGTCEEKIDPLQVDAVITQDGCSAVLDLAGAKLKGTISGNTVHFKGHYEQEGTISKDLKLTLDGNSLSGGGKWSYTTPDETFECGGTEKIKGTRK